MCKTKSRKFSFHTVVLLIGIIGLIAVSFGISPAISQESEENFPHFKSLRYDKVNLRSGPGTDHRILRTYHRAGLPIEILARSGEWLKVRDFQGNSGWIEKSQVSGLRHAILRPWEAGAEISMRSSLDEKGAEIAILIAPSLVIIDRCDGQWCEISLGKLSGWVKQAQLYGTYQNETVDF